MIPSYFVVVGFFINMAGAVSYIRHTLQGKTKPNRVTWFLWALAPLVAFSAQVSEGVGIQSLMTLAVGLGPLLIFLSSFVNPKSVWKLGKFDYFCGAISIVGLVLWLITSNGALAILFAILADGLAALPTIVKAWNYPETESWPIFMLAAINAAITLLTIENFTLENSAFAAYILALCVLMVGLIRFRIGTRIKSRLAA